MSIFWRRALSAALASLFALSSAPLSALAQQVPAHTAAYHSVPAQTTQPTAGAQTPGGGWARTPVNLNLSSTAATIAAPARLIQNPVNIMVGGISQRVTAGQKITPAQMVAVSQMLRTGAQSIQIGANGAANGGSLVIGQRLSQHIANLVVPQGVTLIDRASTLSLTGNLTNAGNLYVLSNNPAVTTAHITAANIFNQQGALISSVLPFGGLAGMVNALPNLNLSLSALNNIVNAGTISSSGHLNLAAGGSITNALPPGVTGPSPLLQALNNVNLNASSITNSGLIASIAGNINVAALAASGQAIQALNINSAGGAFQALNGAINIGSSQSGAATNISLTGGDWLSRELNLYAGAGNVNVDAGNVTGVVNVDAGCAHLLTAAPDLNIGTLNISGDPTIYNNKGSVTLSNLSFTADIAVVASQDISIGDSSGGIVTAPGSNQPGDVTLIAGANFLAPLPLQNLQSGQDTSTTIAINGPSVTGGSVQVPGSISTSGGSVLVVAYAGSGTGSTLAPGTINIGGNVTTKGVNSVNNLGSVTLIAGTNSGNAITVGNITTSNTSPGGNAGAINLLAATPIITAGTLSITNGAPASNFPFATTGLTMTNGSISAGNLLTAGSGGSGSPTGIGGGGGIGGAVTIEGAGPITVGFVRTFGGGGGGGPTGGLGGQGGTVTIGSFNGAVTITGDVNTSGGGGGGSSNSSAAGGPGGGAGSVSIGSPNASISIAGPVLAAGGGNGGSSLGGAGGGGGSFGGAGGGAGNPDNGGSVESFGTGGAGTGTGSAGSDVGTLGNSGAGGAVTIVAPSVSILGTVASLGFSASPFAAESVNALGSGGTLNVTATGFSPVYFADANLDAGALTYAASTGGFFSAGTLDAGVGGSKVITINGTPFTQAVQTSIFGGSPATILEGTQFVQITPGSLVTPAEQIAYIQVALGGPFAQTLVLNQSVPGTSPGSGFAVPSSTSTPSSFTVSSQNIPTGNFTNLVLPAGVTENVATQSVKYTGSVSVSGTLAFNSTGSALIGGSGAVTVTSSGKIQSAQDLTINVTAGGSFINNGNVQSQLNTQILSANSLTITGQGNFSSAASGFVKFAADTLTLGNNVNQTILDSTFVLAANKIVGPTDTSIASLNGNVALSSGSNSTTEFAVGTGASQSAFSLGNLSFFNAASTVQIDQNVTLNVASLSTQTGPPSNLTVNGTFQGTGVMAFSDGLRIAMGAGSAIATTSTLQFGLDTKISGGPTSGSVSGSNVQFAGGILSVDIASISGIISGIGPNLSPPSLAASSVTIKTGSGNLTFAATGVDNSVTGGPIDIEANGGSIGGVTAGSPPSFTTALSSSNGTAGAVTLIAPGGISVGNIDARGFSGANGGTISLTTTSLSVNATFSTSGTGTITVQSNGDLVLRGTGTFQTDATGSTSFLAMAAGHTLFVGDSVTGTQVLVSGGGAVNIRTPNLRFVSSGGAGPELLATSNSSIKVDSGNSSSSVNLTITAPTGLLFPNFGTAGGSIDISPTGNGSLTFSQSAAGSATIFFSGANLTINDSNAVTIDSGVTVEANHSISINMNVATSATTPTFTNNGTLLTSATGATATLLIQNTLGNLNLTGTGAFTQLGAIAGSTVFKSASSITLPNTTSLTENNGSVVFFTPQLLVSSSTAGGAAALFNTTSATGYSLNSSFGCSVCSLSFATSGAATSGTLTLNGAPVATGASAAPLSNAVSDITVGTNLTLSSDHAITLNSTPTTSNASTNVTINGAVKASSANSSITVQSPGNLVLAGTGQFQTLQSGTTSVTATTSLTIGSGSALTSLNNSAGILQLTSPQVSVLTGETVTSALNFVLTTNSLTNAGTLSALGSSPLTVAPPIASSLLALHGSGLLSSPNVTIGSTSTTSLTISDNPTVQGSLNILTGLSGTFTVSSGANVTATGGIHISTNNLTNLGTLTAQGSLSTGGGMFITDGGQHIQGTMSVTGPGTFTATSDTITFSPSSNSITFSNSITLNAVATTTSAAVTINDGADLGVIFSPNSSLSVIGGDGRLLAASPPGQSINISGSGTLAGSQLVLTANGQGANINLTGTPVLTFGSNTFLSATNGAINIVSGTVAHNGTIILNTPAGIPNGFSPTSGVQLLNPTQNPPSPAGATLLVVTDPLTANGSIVATSTAPAGGGPGATGGTTTTSSVTGISTTGVTSNGISQSSIAANVNSNTQSSNLDSQLSTRVSTDFTPYGDTPEQLPANNIAVNANGTPYQVPGTPEGGWQATIDPSGNQVWSCPGCLSFNMGGNDEHSSTQNATRVLERVSESVDDTSPEKLYVADANASAPIPPFSSGTHPVPAKNAGAGSGSSGLHPASNGKDFDFYSLLKGMALFNAGGNMIVATVEGNVNISKGSLAFVYETGHDVSIYNLHDRRTGAVNVRVGNTVVVVPPGKQLVLTKNEDAKFDDVNPGVKISYRNPKPLKLPDGVKGFIADFSIPSAIFGLPPLRAMLTSAKPAEQAAAYQLLKNAVIMADVYAALGPYQAKKQ
jgi:hypothetical protein